MAAVRAEKVEKKERNGERVREFDKREGEGVLRKYQSREVDVDFVNDNVV
jgi:hypothetical protein